MVKEGYKEVRIGPKTKLIPEEWKVKKLKKAIKKRKGKRPNKLFESQNGENFIPYLSVNYLRGNDLPEWCSKDDDNKVEVKENEILMIWDGSYSGNVFMGFNGALSSTMARLKCEDEINNQYLYYQLRNNFKIFQSTTIGTSVPHVAGKIFENLNIPTPRKKEQKKIASILSSVDKSIEKTDEVIEETKELKKGLMKELLTKGIGHSEFKELKFGPEIISLPLDWKILKLKEITDVRSSNVNKKSKNNERHIKLCNYTDVYYNEQINENIKFMEATAKDREIERFTLEKDDVIITKDSETPDDIGVPAVVTKDLSNILCGYHLALLKPNKKLIDGEFLSKMLQSKNITNQFYRLAQGLTRFGLRVTSIKNTKIPVPPLKEQKKIASILSSVDAKIQKEEEYKAKLEKLKKGLMQKLLTGEIRVNTEMEV